MKNVLLLFVVLSLTSCFSPHKSAFTRSTGSSSLNPKTPGSCLVESSDPQESIKGVYHKEIFDDFASGSHYEKHFLELSDKQTIELKSSDILDNLSPWDIVKIDGEFSNQNNILHVHDAKILNSQINAIKEYDLKVLTVVLDFNNRKSSDIYSVNQAKQDLLTYKNYTFKNSGGQMKVNIDANNDGEPDAELITLNQNFTGANCTPQLDNLIEGRLQEHDKADYDTIIFIAAARLTGNDPVCGYGGVANVGQLGSGANGRTHVAIPKFNVILHELGHTLGLGHSGRPGVTYAHRICPMGNSFDNKVTYFNAPKTKMLGLLDLRPELEQTITNNGTYDIEAIGLGIQFTEDSKPRVITVEGNTTYYLEYRHASGEDEDMPSAVNAFKGINITTASLARGGVSSYHQILQSNGDSFQGDGVTISLASNIADSSAKISLNFTNPQPNPPAQENKCSSDKVESEIKEIKKISDNTFEVIHEVNNQNSTQCPDLQIAYTLESDTFKPETEQGVIIPSETITQISTVILTQDGKELSTGDNKGTLKAGEVTGRVSDFELEFNIDGSCL